MVHEYFRHVLRRRYIFSLLSLPALIAFAFVIILLLVRVEQVEHSIGFVDYSGLFENFSYVRLSNYSKNITKFSSEADAQTALEEGQINAYYVLSENYFQTRQARLVAIEEPRGGIYNEFADLVKARIISSQPVDFTERLKNGNNIIISSIDGTYQFSYQDRFKFLSPVLVLFIFILAVLTTSGYFMQAMTEEKENRTIEIMLTSVTPVKMMAGKITAIIGIGITQIVFWIGLIILGFSLRANPNIGREALGISPGIIVLMIVSFILAFIMIGGIIAAIGSVVTEATEGQQITGPFSIPFIIPYLFTFQIIHDPNGTLAQLMTFIPFTAPVTLIMRASLIRIPTWEIALSCFIQIISAIVLVWIAGRAFRLGMLQYSSLLSWRQFLSHVR